MKLKKRGTFTLIDEGHRARVEYVRLGQWHEFVFYDCAFGGNQTIICTDETAYQVLGLYDDYAYFDIEKPFEVPFCPLKAETDGGEDVLVVVDVA